MNELDLHGMRLDEAESAVMRFVDDLFYRSETSGRIIHGMGVIADHLPQWLNNYPYVKKFERAPFNPGATNVYLQIV